jgi:rhodanese-related sulfurtransferase
MNLEPTTMMRDVLERFPGAQRALFRRYHIGGCSSCGFSPEETLEEVCQRNGLEDVKEVAAHILASHEQDRELLISPGQVAELQRSNEAVRLLDVRSREEWDATHIPGATFLAQQTMQEILASWPRGELMVIYDHRGKASLDAAAYFLGQGFKNVRCLQGGIDAWSQEVDSKVPRYRLERA